MTVIAPTVSADLDAIVLAKRTTENLPLVTTGAVNGATIAWTSSDPALVTATDAAYTAPAVGLADPYRGGGIVTGRPDQASSASPRSKRRQPSGTGARAC